jgi:hypothetical protein
MPAINRPAQADAPSALRDIAKVRSAIAPSSYEVKLAYLEQFFARPFGWWSTLAALCLLLLAPLLLADVPPILDYPNHLARLFILAQAGQDPVLDGIWQPHWAVIPDLVIDLLVPPLMHIMTPFAAGKMMLALALLMPVAGTVAYSRAAFGERLYWPMMAGLMVYNITFVLGFINYLISLGGALLAAAAWLSLRGKPMIVRALVGAACASALFFTHIMGVAFFALLVGAAEANELIARRGGVRIGIDAVRRASLLAASFVGPLLLWSLVPPHTPTALGPQWWFVSKLYYFAGSFVAYQPLPGLFVAAAFFCIATFWMAKGRGRVGPGIPFAALALLATYICLPFSAAGGAFIDSRVPLMLTLALAAGISPPLLPSWLRRGAAVTLAAVVIVEVCLVGIVWRAHEAEVAELRASIAPVPPGSRVLAVSAPFDRGSPYWRSAPPGLLALGRLRTDYHLPALVAIDRRAFWPLLFSDPSQHPITVRPPYDTLASQGRPPEVQSLVAERSLDPFWPAPYLQNWPANFDYVLVLNAEGVDDLPHVLPDKLQLLNRSRFAALLRVRKPADSKNSASR